MRESQIEKALVKAAIAAGGEVRKVQWIGRRGAPDRLVLMPGGVSWWIELKAPCKKAEPHQLREHQRMRALGQVVFVVDSLEQVKELFK